MCFGHGWWPCGQRPCRLPLTWGRGTIAFRNHWSTSAFLSLPRCTLPYAHAYNPCAAVNCGVWRSARQGLCVLCPFSDAPLRGGGAVCPQADPPTLRKLKDGNGSYMGHHGLWVIMALAPAQDVATPRYPSVLGNRGRARIGWQASRRTKNAVCSSRVPGAGGWGSGGAGIATH